jgi:hypothetical protein
MDTALGFLFGSLVMAGWLVGFGYAYKRRADIAKWLQDPEMTQAQSKTRELVLKRRIEDAQNELEKLKESK